MAKLSFSKAADAEHEITVESAISSARWSSSAVFAGKKVAGLVETSMVGNGAPVQLIAKNQRGQKLDKVDGEIVGNRFIGVFSIPEETDLDDVAYFEVKLTKHGLSGVSDTVPVNPTPRLKSISWSTEEARRGDVVTLTAELENVSDHVEATLTVFEHDADGGHDRVVELPASVEGGKVTCDWEYEYHEDTDEIPTAEELEQYGETYNPPEYFFTVTIGSLLFGDQVESGLLRFVDWIEFFVLDRQGKPSVGVQFEVTFPDGSTRSGNTDGDGRARVEDVAPGRATIAIRTPGLIQLGRHD